MQQVIGSAYFPTLKPGHNSKTRVERIGERWVAVCSAEGCKGGEKHAFLSRHAAAEDWAKERGLNVGIDVKIV